MTQNISQGGFWNSISAPGSTKTISVQVMRFSNLTKARSCSLFIYECTHITGRETRALQRSAALKIQMELKTGDDDCFADGEEDLYGNEEKGVF